MELEQQRKEDVQRVQQSIRKTLRLANEDGVREPGPGLGGWGDGQHHPKKKQKKKDGVWKHMLRVRNVGKSMEISVDIWFANDFLCFFWDDCGIC